MIIIQSSYIKKTNIYLLNAFYFDIFQILPYLYLTRKSNLTLLFSIFILIKLQKNLVKGLAISLYLRRWWAQFSAQFTPQLKTLVVRAGGRTLPKTATTNYIAQLGLTDKGCFCSGLNQEPFDLLSGLALGCYQPSPVLAITVLIVGFVVSSVYSF